SLGNFTTLAAALGEWKPEALRLWFAGTHYRSSIDYSLVALGQAAKNIERFTNMLNNARSAKTRDEGHASDAAFVATIEKRRSEFEAAMDGDFNTPKALAVLFDLSTDVNKYVAAAPVHAPSLEKALAAFHALEQV